MNPSSRRPRMTISPRPGADGWKPRRIGVDEEPTLNELMEDPIFSHLLVSDGLRREHVESLIAEMRGRLGFSG